MEKNDVPMVIKVKGLDIWAYFFVFPISHDIFTQSPKY